MAETIPTRRKPWLMRKLTDPARWMTIWPWVFAGAPYWDTPGANWDPLMAHEAVHLARQASLFTKLPWRWLRALCWLVCYLTNRKFRLQEEVLAIVAELEATPKARRLSVFNAYTRELSGPEYNYAALSWIQADTALYSALQARGVDLA